MSRVDELQKKYPDVAREYIVKWDALNMGVQDSDAVLKGGFWMRGITNFTRDHGLTLAQLAKNKPEILRPGWIKQSGSFYMRNGFGALVKRSMHSPYQIVEADGRFALYEGDEKVEDVWFPGANIGEPGDKDFWPGSMACGFNKNCAWGSGANVPIFYQAQGCGYFGTGDQCKFCNYNANHQDAAAVGLKPGKPSLDEIVEHHKNRAAKTKVIEILFGIGGAPGLKGEQDKKIEFFTEWIERIAKVTPYHIELIASLMPMSRKQLQRLKDVGATAFRSNMETPDRESFPEVVPGKSKQFGYDRYIEAFQEAVDVFGFGQVNAGLVAGVTMMGDKGFKTWQEARDSFNEGTRSLIKMGVVPSYTSYRSVPGSVYGDDPANLERNPPTDFYIEIGQGLHRSMKEFGMYDKMNKFVMCPLCAYTLYNIADLEITENYGDVGNYVAKEVPYQYNWLSQFVDQVKAKAPAAAAAQ